MSQTPSDLKFTKSHEWVRISSGIATVGITDHAQDQLGDIVFTELPREGTKYSRGQECSVIESVKAAADVYMPLSGEIITINEALPDKPETINQDPYGEGWLFKIKLSDENEISELLSPEAYAAIAVGDH